MRPVYNSTIASMIEDYCIKVVNYSVISVALLGFHE